MKGGLSEAQAGCTIWKDVSKETFELFVQFAYTGDYSIPKTEKRNPAVKPERVERNSFTDQASPSISSGVRTWNKAGKVNEVLAVEEPKEYIEEPVIEEPVVYEEEVVAEASSDHNHGRMFRKARKVVRKKGKGASKNTSIWNFEAEPSDPPPPAEPEPCLVIRTTREKYPALSSPKQLAVDFSSLEYPLLAPRNNYDSTCEPDEEFEPDQCYSNVLLAHASLYVLSDYRLIDSLKALALYKLHKTLNVFQLDDENVEDIVDFARYTYSEDKGFEEGIGGLRGLVCRYMATNAVVLSHSDEFMDLLGEGGEFVKDFFKFELQIIH
jgi:hypothetical protein